MCRHLAALAFDVTKRTADVRMLDAAGEKPACLHHLHPRVVDRRGRVIERANQREWRTNEFSLVVSFRALRCHSERSEESVVVLSVNFARNL